ncbi:MAG: NAD(P)/FAD-dependent oxidoreductase [Ruminococcaceae bacterium]|nr:NAD(P)/FAD-dependent oxidoreductase [Oscillospiraceae bacterium]
MNFDDNIKITVIGAGPAGMMAAISAANYGADVTVLERNQFAGKKLRITGKGRCNVTNNCAPNQVLEAVSRNPKFLYGVLNRFTPADTMEFFEDAGVPLKTERGRRVFPVSDKAADIQDALVRKMKEAGVRVVYGARVSDVVPVYDDDSARYEVKYGNRSVRCDAVIFATGGVSYSGTGSTGDGHRILEKLGVNITPLTPSLVPIETEEDFYNLSGLTLKNVRLTVLHDGDEVWSEMGEMLMTHFGVSGPLVLSASANMQKYPIYEYDLKLNLKPALSREELDARVLSDFAKYSARDFINSLDDLLPKKLIPYVISQSGIDDRKKTGEITREERFALLDALDSFRITPRSFRPIDEAIITSGGVDVKEISPKTMELKAFPGIFVCGELVDVDAYTGGYNLQLAFSMGKAAGEAAAMI